MMGGKATSQGHSLGGTHPLNVHACSLITLLVQMPQEPRRAAGLLIPGRVSQMCSLSPTGPPFEAHSPLAEVLVVITPSAEVC